MDPSFILINDTLDVEEFLCDVSMHLRRREMKTLLSYIGLSSKETDLLLYENKARTGTERGLLINHGTVVEGSSSVNFLEQRKEAMHTWWEYAANLRQRNTSQYKAKVIDLPASSLPVISKKHDVMNVEHNVETLDKISDTAWFPPLRPAPVSPMSYQQSVATATNTPHKEYNKNDQHISAKTSNQFKDIDSNSQLSESHKENSTLLPITSRAPQSIPVVQVPVIETDSDERSTSLKSLTKTLETADFTDHIMIDQSQQTDLVGCDPTPDQIAIYGSNITLEELLRKLWRSLHSCGLKKVVDLQQRWLIQIDMKQGRADLYPKMTWGTPLPPQTPFTYPPYKKINHMAVMGSTISIESKSLSSGLEISPRSHRYEQGNNETTRSLISEPAKASKFLPHAIRDQLNTRSYKSRGITSISLDGAPVTSFPMRDSWKLRTDTVRRKGATITIHVTVDDVTLPSQPSETWGSTLHITPQQIRERVARVFFSRVLQDSRSLCKAIDRIERIRGLVIESAQKRIGGGGNGLEIATSELVLQCRCLHPKTVEQLWLFYQSGQLRENVQAGLVLKRSQHACSVEHLRVRVYIAEEEYRRALGLLRRKPMPNTKTGRVYVTAGTGGAVGGAGGLAHAQKQALISVTQYMKLPVPTPHLQASPPVPPTTSLAHIATINSQKSPRIETKSKITGHLVHKVLAKELDAVRERLRMCEDSWCDFAANRFSRMLRCTRHIMQRRIMGATAKNQLTPRCTSLSIFLALWKAINSTKVNDAIVSSKLPHTASVAGSYNSIALYPTDVTFSHVDLVTTADDDDEIVKARKSEERDFKQSYAVFSEILTELGVCRSILQDRIISRLTTNPTVAPSKHLYLAKDIYNLMERWRHILTKDFNFVQDESIQRLSTKILTNDIVTTSFDKEIQDQFPGIIGILPLMFHIAEKIMVKLRELLPSKDNISTNQMYPALVTPRHGAIQSRYLSSWLRA